MRVSRQSGRRCGRAWVSAAAGACMLLSAHAALGSRAETGAWDSAVKAREIFEAKLQGTHTKIEYAHVMDEFRAIYHGNPSDAHAARAVEQVAELLGKKEKNLTITRLCVTRPGSMSFWRRHIRVGRWLRVRWGMRWSCWVRMLRMMRSKRKRVRALLVSEYPRSAEAREVKQGPGIRDQGSGESVGASGAQGSVEHYRKPSTAAAAKVEDAPVEKADLKAEPGAEVDDEHPSSGKVDAGLVKPGKMATVTGIRHWSTATYTRVAIDLGDT